MISATTTNERSLSRAASRFILLFAILLAATSARGDNTPQKELPLPGEVFSVEGRPAFVILPPSKPATAPIPWVWYAPTLPGLPAEAEKWMFERFTEAGCAIAGIDVGESYGSPEGCAQFSALYTELTAKRGFAAKPVLLGRSRGGLMTLAWAVANPDKVAGFAGIYPVCNLLSYPGLDKASAAYHTTAGALARECESAVLCRKRAKHSNSVGCRWTATHAGRQNALRDCGSQNEHLL